MSDAAVTQERIDRLSEGLTRLRRRIGDQFLGQEEVTELLLTCVAAGGHALLEGAPGLGKTTLVRSLADSVALGFRRIQFTPDLMPPDILGARVLRFGEDGSRDFVFEQGPIFTHVLLADEINRATPRTQSALLEAMAERQVTIHGEPHALEDPFLVIATQNPIEMEGTYPLPEAQLDRFLVKIHLALPKPSELAEILAATTGRPADQGEPVLTIEEVRELRALVRQIKVSDEIVRFVANLIHATHPASDLAPKEVQQMVRYGASPRGGQALLLAGKARALFRGELHVSMEDLEALAPACLRHRLILGYEAEAEGVDPDHLVDAAFRSKQ